MPRGRCGTGARAQFSFADLATSPEHRLEYTEIHQQFLELLEGHVSAFLKFKNANEEEFLEALKGVQDRSEEEWKPFRMRLEKTDYQIFAKQMQVLAVGMGPVAPPPAEHDGTEE